MGQQVAAEKFKVVASTKELSMVRERIKQYLAATGISEKVLGQIVLAADEAVTNVIKYGYKKDGVSEVEIEISIVDGVITLVVRDTAVPPFDPTGHVDPDIAVHIKSGKKGGLGIYLMRKIMDEMKYRTLDNGVNELILVKNVFLSGG